MPRHPHRAVEAGKKNQVAGFGPAEGNLPVYVVKINRPPGHSNIKMIKYIGNIARAIKAPFGIGRGVQVGDALQAFGKGNQAIRRCAAGSYFGYKTGAIGWWGQQGIGARPCYRIHHYSFFATAMAATKRHSNNK